MDFLSLTIIKLAIRKLTGVNLETSSTSEAIVQAEAPIIASHNSARSIILSCMIGNALEWYDFVIYGYFAVIFGILFFPNADPITQILSSWAVFWSGFIARPLGSIILGHIGDKTSRKHALTMSIYIMAIPTVLIGLLPTFEQVGIIATISLIFLRSMQGFALGGEFTGSMVFLIEHAPPANRGVWGSWASFSAIIGVIIGSIFVALLSSSLSTESMQDWGWRIPFILSIFGSILGGYMRNNLQDPTVFIDVKSRCIQECTPLRELFQRHKSKIGTIVLLDFLTAIGFFVIVIFFATYFEKYLHFPENISFIINTINMVIFAMAILTGGYLADKIGVKNIIKYTCLGFMLLSYPLFALLQMDSYFVAFAVQAIFAVMLGVFFGTIPIALVNIMPTEVRCSGLSIGHNISMAIFGGGAPFLATAIIEQTNNLASPAYLLIAAGFLSFCAKRFI